MLRLGCDVLLITHQSKKVSKGHLWLGFGFSSLWTYSDRGNNAAANYYSLVEIGKIFDINLLVYLADVLSLLLGRKPRRNINS
jgi:hypothetical protein